MTRDDIIRMARQAGIAKHGLGWTCWEGQLERFAALIAAAERDSILKMSAENWYKTQADYDAAIRARGNE